MSHLLIYGQRGGPIVSGLRVVLLVCYLKYCQVNFPVAYLRTLVMETASG